VELQYLYMLVILSPHSQLYTVGTLRPGEHETVRVKQSNVKKIIVVRLLC